MSENWRDRCRGKLLGADGAIRRIKSGDRVLIGTGCGEPQALVRSLLRAGNLTDVEIIQLLNLSGAPFVEPRFYSTFRTNALLVGDAIQPALSDLRADHTPLLLSQAPAMLREKRLPVDVALISVSEPDEHGYCSLGPSVDITKAAAESARTVIAQVNPQLPRTLGDSFLHVDHVHLFVEGDEPPIVWAPHQPPSDVARQIASHVARLVHDGATLQAGLGEVSQAVLEALSERGDLGIHTDVLSDGMMQLVRRGVVTGRRKTLNPGRIIAASVAGSADLLRFAHRNPMIEMHPSDVTSDPFMIARQDGMISLSDASQIDLTGQASRDSMGPREGLGFGGQEEFLRGAACAKDGKAILALPSTIETPDGPRSRIVPALPPGATMIASRVDVQYVVTEFGAAYLQGRTLRERAMSLIRIAHPDFRAELLHAAKLRRLVFADQIVPPASHPYPQQYESIATLHDGSSVFLRPIRPDDESLIRDMFYSFSEQTVYLRYHGTLRSMPHDRLQMFCTIDYETEMALVGVVGQAGSEEIVCVGRYMTDPSHQSADVAFVVADAWQRKGLGSVLFERLIATARAQGIHRFTADVLMANSGMLKIFHRSNMNLKATTESGVVHVVMTPKTE